MRMDQCAEWILLIERLERNQITPRWIWDRLFVHYKYLVFESRQEPILLHLKREFRGPRTMMTFCKALNMTKVHPSHQWRSVVAADDDKVEIRMVCVWIFASFRVSVVMELRVAWRAACHVASPVDTLHTELHAMIGSSAILACWLDGVGRLDALLGIEIAGVLRDVGLLELPLALGV